jgi:hypothetical protein
VLPHPVKEDSGDNPTSPPALPFIIVVPVLVIAEPAKIAKVDVVPRFTVGCAAKLPIGKATSIINNSISINAMERILFIFIFILISPFFINLFSFILTAL